jgi:hypothetical protein
MAVKRNSTFTSAVTVVDPKVVFAHLTEHGFQVIKIDANSTDGASRLQKMDVDFYYIESQADVFIGKMEIFLNGSNYVVTKFRCLDGDRVDGYIKKLSLVKLFFPTFATEREPSSSCCMLLASLPCAQYWANQQREKSAAGGDENIEVRVDPSSLGLTIANTLFDVSAGAVKVESIVGVDTGLVLTKDLFTAWWDYLPLVGQFSFERSKDSVVPHYSEDGIVKHFSSCGFQVMDVNLTSKDGAGIPKIDIDVYYYRNTEDVFILKLEIYSAAKKCSGKVKCMQSQSSVLYLHEASLMNFLFP